MLNDTALTQIENAVFSAVSELCETASLTAAQILVIGASSSEVIGYRIGTAGSQEVAQAIFTGVRRVQEPLGFHVAFQCCEHLNRALVVERRTLEQFRLEEVSAVPIPGAGGAVAAHAYRALHDAVLVEHLSAHAGLDIGDTLIGMHLWHVAVPVRLQVQKIGQAHVTAARTRPKLIGGTRAVYKLEGLGDSC